MYICMDTSSKKLHPNWDYIKNPHNVQCINTLFHVTSLCEFARNLHNFVLKRNQDSETVIKGHCTCMKEGEII